MPVERALVSVYDKSGLTEFVRQLAARGIEIVSTGGTAKLLREAGITVRDVSDLTGWPEMLGGRVKTLHPKVHGGILFRRGEAGDRAQTAEHKIAPIDLVVVNLYPFEATAAKAGPDSRGIDREHRHWRADHGSLRRKKFRERCSGHRSCRLRRRRRRNHGARRSEPRDAARARAQGVRAHRALRRKDRDGTRAPLGEQRFDRAGPAPAAARAAALRLCAPAGVALR